MITRLAHLCFFTDDAKRLVAFYRQAFGFPLIFEMKHDDGTPFGWYLGLGNDSFIEIFDQKGAVKQWGGEVGQLKEAACSRYRHFCLQSENLEELRQHLVRKGIEVSDITEGMDFSYQCWTKDPDGNAIELMQYTERSLQFSTPQEL